MTSFDRYYMKITRLLQAVKNHFDVRDVGDADAWGGKMDGQNFYIFAMKEPDYVTSIMSTFGTLERWGRDKTREFLDAPGQPKRRKTFKYPEMFANHFQFQDAVDANNSARMDPIALEETWKTSRWECRVFQFLLAVSEVNARMVRSNIFDQPTLSQQEFRKSLAQELINNPYLAPEGDSPRRGRRQTTENQHELISIPKFRTFNGAGELVPCRTAYIQLLCVCKRARARKYCQCSPGAIRCQTCYIEHLQEVM